VPDGLGNLHVPGVPQLSSTDGGLRASAASPRATPWPGHHASVRTRGGRRRRRGLALTDAGREDTRGERARAACGGRGRSAAENLARRHGRRASSQS